jgi:hypothetical protein
VPAIKIRQIITITPIIGIQEQKALKPLSASGLVFAITPMQTRENANNVPILTMCGLTLGTKPANIHNNTIKEDLFIRCSI